MAIVQPGNDAFRVFIREAAVKLGRTEPIIAAVAIVTNMAKETCIRLVTINLGQLEVGREMVVGGGNIARAIADLLGDNSGGEVVVKNQHLQGNSYRWVLWNPISERPEVVGDAEIAVSYHDVL